MNDVIKELQQELANLLDARTGNDVGQLLRFSIDPDEELRRRVAGNKNTPDFILARMVDGNDAYVQHLLALNKNTPPEIRFVILLEHPEWVK